MTSILTHLDPTDGWDPDRPTRTAARLRAVNDPHAGAIRPVELRPAPPAATKADDLARKVLLRLLAGLRGGRLTIVEHDGTVTRHGHVGGDQDGIDVTVRLHTPAVWREVALKASRGLGESYVDGWWTTDDLVGLVQLCIRNLEGLDEVRNRWAKVSSPVADTWRRLRPASKERDRREIAAHYDLGNDFFELFLDPTMAYSCGLFSSPADTLQQAQENKFDRLLSAIDLQPDEHLVEIGTGWGGLAVHAARHFGARVTTTTISREQHRHTTDLVARLGLQDRVAVLLEDYR
ncbi:MAG: class I SAM-dependent methyltransferase, partial [Acidimicrobiales bacterium]|nr:class I SAM-dependent methyltransferase [Acidimicrobiales bacterium]